MTRFRKRPVEIDAIQYKGPESIPALSEFVGKTMTIRQGIIRIRTLEGEMTVTPGDWVIRGVKGEFYPCKPDIFEETYEAVWV
jgi:hypothetical protein